MILITLFLTVSGFSAQRAVYIGDSHSTTRYGLFEKLFSNSKYPELAAIDFVAGQGVCGAGIHYFLRGNLRTRCGFMQMDRNGIKYKKTGRSIHIDRLLRHRSDTVIVQLGGNHSQNPKAAGPYARKLANKILDSGKRCLWIGTATSHPKRCPKVRKDRQKIHKVIRHALNNLARRDGKACEYIDSYSNTKVIDGKYIRSARDCRHYTGTGYSQWAKAVHRKIENFLLAP